MVVMAIPGTDLAQIGTVAAFILAHLHLGARKDEDPRDARIGGGGLDHLVMLAGPAGVDIGAFGPAQGNGGDILALISAEVQAIGRQHPDIGIQPDLVTGVPCQHGTAARLADVTDVKPLPAGLARGESGQVLEKVDGCGMAPVAVARQAHGLPCGPGFRQFDRARDAALGVTAEGCGLCRCGCALCAEKLLGRLCACCIRQRHP